MKNLIVLVIVLITSNIFGQISGYVESQNSISKQNNSLSITPQMNIYLVGPIANSKEFSWSSWVLISKEWSEGYFGFSYSPINNLSVSVYYGLESEGERYAMSLWTKIGNASFLSILEDGSGDLWIQNILNYSIKQFSLGIHNETFRGTGPHLEYNLSKKITLLGTYFFDKDDDNMYLSLRLNL